MMTDLSANLCSRLHRVLIVFKIFLSCKRKILNMNVIEEITFKSGFVYVKSICLYVVYQVHRPRRFSSVTTGSSVECCLCHLWFMHYGCPILSWSPIQYSQWHIWHKRARKKPHTPEPCLKSSYEVSTCTARHTSHMIPQHKCRDVNVFISGAEWAGSLREHTKNIAAVMKRLLRPDEDVTIPSFSRYLKPKFSIISWLWPRERKMILWIYKFSRAWFYETQSSWALWRRMLGCWMDDELERVCIKVVVA
jgi:hypothetical protein